MGNYYSDKLSAINLKRCYDVGSSRVQQYLKSEIDFVLKDINPNDLILELGCGYGRVLDYLIPTCGFSIGLDRAHGNLIHGFEYLGDQKGFALLGMDAIQLGFKDRIFDKVVCIQNGISAFRVDYLELIKETIRITKPGGIVYFSTYSDSFWDDRLEWFERQADAGLLGEIDYTKTGDGIIVCSDGFKGTSVSPSQFQSLMEKLDLNAKIEEVDKSSLFFTIFV